MRAVTRRVCFVAGLAVVVGSALVGGAARGANAHANYRAVCAGAAPSSARCHTDVVVDSNGNPAASKAPTGLSPATIKSAYTFPMGSTAGAGRTIAIVDAYNDPTAEADLGVFSTQYGLPACTTANGCFSKVNQTGGTNYPQTSTNWALEISLDVQWAHAIAPGARILLVEASSNSFANLLTAEDYAKTHAQYVTNSWGGSEFSGESVYDSHFVQSGVSFFVSAGDAGLPAEYPSASPNVISVGGTTLNFGPSGNLTSETGWSSGGGGCSAYETRVLGPVELWRVRTGRVRRQAGNTGRLARRRPCLGRVRLRQHPPPGAAGLVQGRRYERLVADVGRSLRRRWRGRHLRVRVRQQHHVSRHHLRQQRRVVPGRLRPLHRPWQLGRHHPVTSVPGCPPPLRRGQGSRSTRRSLAERPRSRTEQAVGYTTGPILKTGWATGPVPLRGQASWRWPERRLPVGCHRSNRASELDQSCPDIDRQLERRCRPRA